MCIRDRYTIADFFEKLCNLKLEYILFNSKEPQKAKNFAKWLLSKISKINNYHGQISESNIKENLKEIQDQKDIKAMTDTFYQQQQQEINPGAVTQSSGILKTNKSTKFQQKVEFSELEDLNYSFIMNSELLKKYYSNKLLCIAYSFQRIFMLLIKNKHPFYISLVNAINYGQYFVTLVKRQYFLINLYIKTKTENIHLLDNYVEEANIRLQTFESIIKSNNSQLKQQFITTQFITYICSECLENTSQFDVLLYKSDMKFLPFRNYLPIRNESLAMLTSIAWNKNEVPILHKELLIGISNSNLVLKEQVLLEQGKLVFLSSLYFFTLLVYLNDQQLMFLMKHEKIIEKLNIIFQENKKLGIYFPLLKNFLINQKDS
eukprot:TRINITY_DN34875_c0_g1_i1.p1 TRINITY_DN34875_c0_g1~~TRINITY_DN34875_c0_g1_i1.p1  ORF type:complete len:376 (-),score=54.28 TRINITY_DN34875_c0_g1_i1:57-1184(-)